MALPRWALVSCSCEILRILADLSFFLLIKASDSSRQVSQVVLDRLYWDEYTTALRSWDNGSYDFGIHRSQGEVLLLLRNSVHNHDKWGLPGGNADPEDGGQLAVTAQREAVEEMGSMPPFVPAGQVHTM